MMNNMNIYEFSKKKHILDIKEINNNRTNSSDYVVILDSERTKEVIMDKQKFCNIHINSSNEICIGKKEQYPKGVKMVYIHDHLKKLSHHHLQMKAKQLNSKKNEYVCHKKVKFM